MRKGRIDQGLVRFYERSCWGVRMLNLTILLIMQVCARDAQIPDHSCARELLLCLYSCTHTAWFLPDPSQSSIRCRPEM